MEQIAFIADHTYIYWNDAILALASAAAVCLFLALYVDSGRNAVTAAVFLPLAAGASLVLSRLAHWYFRPESFRRLRDVWDLTVSGDMALMGAFAGCILAAAGVRLLRITKDLPELLNSVAVAGCLGIAVGRLASFFDTSDRGMILTNVTELPWAVSTINPVSGTAELRLATFLLQAMACGVIFLGLLVFCLRTKRKKNNGKRDTLWLFLLFYGMFQVVLDSTRYDSLYFRSNGFVSVVQVLNACALAVVTILFAVRLVKAGGWRKRYVILWLLQAGCFGLAGYMEYHVQRHGAEAVRAYSIMSAALAGIVLLALATRHMAGREEQAHMAWLRLLQEEKNRSSQGNGRYTEEYK